MSGQQRRRCRDDVRGGAATPRRPPASIQGASPTAAPLPTHPAADLLELHHHLLHGIKLCDGRVAGGGGSGGAAALHLHRHSGWAVEAAIGGVTHLWVFAMAWQALQDEGPGGVAARRLRRQASVPSRLGGWLGCTQCMQGARRLLRVTSQVAAHCTLWGPAITCRRLGSFPDLRIARTVPGSDCQPSPGTAG